MRESSLLCVQSSIWNQINQSTFIPAYATVLSSLLKATLLNVSTDNSTPIQMPKCKYFFTALFQKSAHAAIPSICTACARGHVSCNRIQMTILPIMETLNHSLVQAKVIRCTKHASLVPLYNQLLAAVFHSWRQWPIENFGRQAWCFSFPYLHIFYHLLCKVECRCKHRIHLYWDRMHAHHSLIQQHIHQHLQKWNTVIKMSLGWYL